MIGLDTNILLRMWLDDDPRQLERIAALMAERGTAPKSLMVSDVVLVEALWTLSTSYSRSKPELLAAVRGLLAETTYTFESRAVVVLAVAHYEGSSCGFSDCLIAAKNAALGCEFTATFDQRMRKLSGVRVM